SARAPGAPWPSASRRSGPASKSASRAVVRRSPRRPGGSGSGRSGRSSRSRSGRSTAGSASSRRTRTSGRGSTRRGSRAGSCSSAAVPSTSPQQADAEADDAYGEEHRARVDQADRAARLGGGGRHDREEEAGRDQDAGEGGGDPDQPLERGREGGRVDQDLADQGQDRQDAGVRVAGPEEVLA